MLFIDLPMSEILEKEEDNYCRKESKDDVQNNFEILFDPGEVAIGHSSLHIEHFENLFYLFWAIKALHKSWHLASRSADQACSDAEPLPSLFQRSEKYLQEDWRGGQIIPL